MNEEQMPTPPSPRERANSQTGLDWLPGLIVLLLLILGLVYAYFKFIKPEDLPSVKPTSAEQARTATITTNTTEHAKYTDRDKLLARIKALRSDSLANAKGKDKAATEKARLSALKYAETNKPEDCRDALLDCQEENATKAYSLAVQERMIAGFESSDSLHRGEIDRLRAVVDTLGAGWAKANLENGKLEKKIERKNTLLKIGAAVIAVLGVLVAAR